MTISYTDKYRTFIQETGAACVSFEIQYANSSNLCSSISISDGVGIITIDTDAFTETNNTNSIDKARKQIKEFKLAIALYCKSIEDLLNDMEGRIIDETDTLRVLL